MTSLLCALSVVLGADALHELSRAQEQLFDRIAPGVVYISTTKSFGSGFFITETGLILTNAHVVEGVEAVTVVLHDGRRFRGEVVERGAGDVDVALVKVPVDKASALRTDGAAARVGQWAGSVGHGAGAVWTFSTGMVSNVYTEGAERPVFQTQIPINPGNSGGPIFTSDGTVIGLVTARLTEAAAINFGVPIEIARRSLKQMFETCACVRIAAPPKVPVFFDGKMVGLGPVVVVPSVKPGAHEAFVVKGGAMVKRTVEFPRERELDLSK